MGLESAKVPVDYRQVQTDGYVMTTDNAEEENAGLTGGAKVIVFPVSRAPGRIYLALKRSFDLIFSLICLITLSPVLLITAAAIYLEDGGPVLHRRICAGPGKQEYIMYKFRSMKVGADGMLDQFTDEQRKRYLAGEKLDDDPRITKVGQFIRRCSIDELPQLISVLKSDMSIVGPRPVIEREAAEYGEYREKLLNCKPGITGYYQVYGRGDIPYLSEEAKRLQLYYVDHKSIRLDIKILFKTVGIVFSGKGAR